MNIRSLLFAALGLIISIGITSYFVARDLSRIHQEEVAAGQQQTPGQPGQPTDPNAATNQSVDPNAAGSQGTQTNQTYSETSETSATGVQDAKIALTTASRDLERCGQSYAAGTTNGQPSYNGCRTTVPNVTVERADTAGYSLSAYDQTNGTLRLSHTTNGDCKSSEQQPGSCTAW